MKLNFNHDKSEFIIIGDKHSRESLLPKFPVTFLQISVMPAEEIKNLGVAFNSENTFDSYVGKVCHYDTCLYHVKDM